MKCRSVKLGVAVWLGLSGVARGALGYADPAFPAEQQPLFERFSRYNVAALEHKRTELQQALDRFPVLESRITSPNRLFGYLSERHPVSRTNPLMNAWVQLHIFGAWTTNVDGIALVPAYYPAHSVDGNYGFPKRFKIEVFSHQEPDRAEVVVDWSNADFPDPGLHPTFFHFSPRDVQTVRLTVLKGAEENGAQFFALDELMVFQSGNNVAPPAYNGLTASDSVEEPPYWLLRYLTNRKIHVGAFAQAYHPVPDFVHYFNDEQGTAQLPQLLIDLGEQKPVGRVELYPAKVEGLPVPAFKFPRKYKVELLRSLHPERVSLFQVVEGDAEQMRMHWHPFNSMKGRYVRITFLELPEHHGVPVLALGEVRVIGQREDQQVNWARDKQVQLTPTGNVPAQDVALLVNGFSNGREVMGERDYIQQLAERKERVRALEEVEDRLLIARATRKQWFWMLGGAAGLSVFFVLLFWIMYQRSVRQRALYELRQQIAADLHDDISSNLGTISMITARLKHDMNPALVTEKLVEISHIAQECFVSVKEIIWHMDADVVHFPELFETIRKTSQLILSDTQVECRLLGNIPEVKIAARTRRNMMLLIKEALYNCAKYAGAEHVVIHAAVKGAVLVLSMQDDGCGFDPTEAAIKKSESGRGLLNMKRRARLLGAELEVESERGSGTLLTLQMPI